MQVNKEIGRVHPSIYGMLSAFLSLFNAVITVLKCWLSVHRAYWETQSLRVHDSPPNSSVG